VFVSRYFRSATFLQGVVFLKAGQVQINTHDAGSLSVFIIIIHRTASFGRSVVYFTYCCFLTA